ncbi:hypothetical protein APR50_32620 [Variovorax paradoxus]|jgi:hypothetical protein|uniref:hypothetical protein n=1 Tax=Variovorax paradoxus TaxID=34073 RepID=UPI0006E59800|nr:hypothetical protein APR52_13975 [Variovorax paradoxus]KPV00466.1 hypothetical protein APR50_32620 [Variovorax paradoxus]KPV08077.1 hypothetical protein APR49_16045 [Variovorax paradoxus]KPV22541.1 hypothetical protein APR51_10040 [Variovorax paradoxus]KPV35389.1 hypothetical protein APR48_04410 [Variovorax paradoxus]
MHNNPGRAAHPKPAVPAPIEFSEEQLQAFDRGYTAAKNAGALPQFQADAALRMDLAHQRGAA